MGDCVLLTLNCQKHFVATNVANVANVWWCCNQHILDDGLFLEDGQHSVISLLTIQKFGAYLSNKYMTLNI